MRRPEVMSHARRRTTSASIATADASVRGHVERAGYEVVVGERPDRAARRRVAGEEPANWFVRRGDDGRTVGAELGIPDAVGVPVRGLDHDPGLVQRVRVAHLLAGGEGVAYQRVPAVGRVGDVVRVRRDGLCDQSGGTVVAPEPDEAVVGDRDEVAAVRAVGQITDARAVPVEPLADHPLALEVVQRDAAAAGTDRDR